MRDAIYAAGMSLLLVILGLITPLDRARSNECGAVSRVVELAEARKVDRIQVYVKGGPVPDATSRVKVSAGQFGRGLTVLGGGLWGLKFGPALEARSLMLTVEPGPTRGVCIDKIVLLSGSDEVAIVTP